MPMVRNIIGAMEAVGCMVQLDRHISCDMCNTGEKTAMRWSPAPFGCAYKYLS